MRKGRERGGEGGPVYLLRWTASVKLKERKRKDEQDLLPPADLYINCLVGCYACSSPCKRIVMVMKVPRVGVARTVQRLKQGRTIILDRRIRNFIFRPHVCEICIFREIYIYISSK